ncbi:heat shock factor protein HSF24 isoform X2 [Physcomitrium patens]|uniref:HSF-type DNA-binding domain-containing protein n=1 Tax=Physcomitrium patens TaxID=3218 RepID=A0A7I4FEC5_PHYPA|nr:heat stress transcription factor B-2b-like isoform X2 [Physcomitrium patens]|eukprot:XP_024359691.1 heat stress transcription factor B-2b-like isoform X2 [Physcomitrella patens]
MSLAFDNSETGCMLFYDCHRSVPAPFLTKTYHLVNDPATNDIVSWGEDGTTFVVWRPPEFARDLLPNYFKHNNFSSFVRQLNTYGFRKVVPERWEFANDYFRRGERHLLCEIHRRKALQPASGTGSAQQSRSLSPSTSIEDQAWSPISSPMSSPLPISVPTQHPTLPVMSISDENERLRKDNNLLLCEVSRLRRLYEETVSIIHQQYKATPTDFSALTSRVGASGQSLETAGSVTALSGDAASQHRSLNPISRGDFEIPELSVHVRTTNHNFCKTISPPTFPERAPNAVFINPGNPKFPTGPKLTASAESLNSSNKLVKLFGVPLHSQVAISEPATIRREPAAVASTGLKRRQSDSPWDPVCEISDMDAPLCDQVFVRPPPRKCLRPESEPRPSPVQPPWLLICATRDEGVYI